MTDDVIDRLAAYRPAVPEAWSTTERAHVRAEVFDDIATAAGVRFRSRPRWPTTAAAAAAIIALIGGVLVAVGWGHAGRRGDTGAAGAPWNPPAGLSDRAEITGHQWEYTVTSEEQTDGPGASSAANLLPNIATMRGFISADGNLVRIVGEPNVRSEPRTTCYSNPRSGDPSLEFPTAAFLATLPTDVDDLALYLGGHVGGSSSRDEAVFVAVGDVLRGANSLASPKLRAAMLAVLSRLPEVTLHTGDTDTLGRRAIRADFVDQAIRPGEVRAYYFDPADFRLIEERIASNGEPTSYDGPSPAYSGTRTDGGVDPIELGDTYSSTIIRSHSVVDQLPPEAQNCPQR